jgi:hypothetical protein
MLTEKQIAQLKRDARRGILVRGKSDGGSLYKTKIATPSGLVRRHRAGVV